MKPITKLPVPLEAEVQRNCLALLHRHGVLAWRNNTGSFAGFGKGGRKRPVRAGLGKGSADLVGVLPGGRWLCVEVKRPGERATPNQLEWLEAVNRAGGLAFWVDSPATLDRMFRLLDHCRARGGVLTVRFEAKAKVVFVMREELP